MLYKFCMPFFKNPLDELLADAVLASGVNRQVALERVRELMRKTSTNTLATWISQITSLPELTMLQAAGVPAPLQRVFFAQIAQLQQSLGQQPQGV
jgi:hypothetical protein